MNNTEGHLYMAEHFQTRPMRHLALTFSQFILLKLESALQSNKEINQ